MGRKKKRSAPDPYERIFCYYCDRTFQNEHELLMHQREKHLRCPTCNKRMISIGSLTVHSTQMHNVVITTVPNSIPSRSSPEVAVLGMQGIPQEYYQLQQQQQTSKLQKKQQHMQPPFQHPAQSMQQSFPYQQQQQQQQPYSQYSSYPSYQQHHQPYPYQPHPYYNSSPYYHRQQQQYPNQYQYGSYPPRKDYKPYERRPNNHQYNQNSYPSHPTSTAPATSAQKEYTPSSVAPVSQPSSNVAQTVKIVFDNVDMSMEELRAQLPRYRIK